VVCLQVKVCDPHLSALEMRFSQRGAIQIYIYLYRYLLVESCILVTHKKKEVIKLERHSLEHVFANAQKFIFKNLILDVRNARLQI